MRVPFRISNRLSPYLQKGGALPGVQYGGSFFNSALTGLKRFALPTLKAVGKAALPMVQEAITTSLSTKGSIKERLKAGAQTALTKKNLMGLANAGKTAVLARPF